MKLALLGLHIHNLHTIALWFSRQNVLHLFLSTLHNLLFIYCAYILYTKKELFDHVNFKRSTFNEEQLKGRACYVVSEAAGHFREWAKGRSRITADFDEAKAVKYRKCWSHSMKCTRILGYTVSTCIINDSYKRCPLEFGVGKMYTQRFWLHVQELQLLRKLSQPRTFAVNNLVYFVNVLYCDTLYYGDANLSLEISCEAK